MLLETHWTGVVVAEYMSVAASETTAQAFSPLRLSTKYRQNKNLPHTVLPTKLRDGFPYDLSTFVGCDMIYL